MRKNSKIKSRLLVKNSNEIENQEYEEIISEEELRKRGGIVGGKTYIFSAYIRTHYEKIVFHNYADNLIGLAEYMANKKMLYVRYHNGYKLMKVTSIIDYIHRESKQVMKEMMQDEIKKKNIKLSTKAKKYRNYCRMQDQ